MKLIIMRHATTRPFAPSGRDIDRSLTDQGHDECVSISNQLLEYGVKPNLLLVSSACRTIETSKYLKLKFGLGDEQVVFIDELYNSSSLDIWNILNNKAKDAEEIIIIAHNPGVSNFINQYCDYDGFDYLSTANAILMERSQQGSFYDFRHHFKPESL